MRRIWIRFAVVSMLAVALIGCQKKTEQVAETTTNDSLLSTTPVEQPAGDISPQTDYQPPAENTQEPPATSKPSTSRPKSTPSHSSSSSSHTASSTPTQRGTLVASGTPVQVSVSTQISSENSNVGDTWTGEVKEAVIVGNEVVIPAGSKVEGVVSAVTAAQKGTKASLDLAVKSITVSGESYAVNAGTEAIVAGSPRARNLGAIAGGAAAGALLGKAVGGSGKGAVIGGILGGAAATGAVAASKGFQVVIKEGTVITFNVSKDVRIRA